MEVIGEYHGEFTGDAGHTLSWSDYGFHLHIPKGSLATDGIGRVDVYAIYNGPFQLPADGTSVSAFYCVTLSCDLLKPATIEIQHCCDISDRYDKEDLTFVSASLSSGPPYKFDIISGGRFDIGSNYATLERSSFSIFSVFLKGVRALFGSRKREAVSPLQGTKQLKRQRREEEDDEVNGIVKETEEEELKTTTSTTQRRHNVQYACFYQLVKEGKNWIVRIFVIKNLVAHYQVCSIFLEPKLMTGIEDSFIQLSYIT